MKDESARSERGAPRHVSRPAKSATPKEPRNRTAHPTKHSEHELVLTNLDKMMYPEDHVTKGDVIEFYRRISRRLLPFLHDRPATLERFPDGIDNGRGPHFW